MRRNRITLNCKHCEASYEVKYCLRDSSKFCSNQCRGKSQAQTNCGEGNPNYRGGSTKTKCTDCNKKINRNYNKTESRCRPCNIKYAVGRNATNWRGGSEYPSCVNCDAQTGDHDSILCRNCYRGAMHPFWRGGTAQLQALIRATKENRQWIRQCMYRDGYSCQDCGAESKGNNLQVHHIKQFALILKENGIDSIEKARGCGELWDMENGVTLCRECHKLTESFNRKLK